MPELPEVEIVRRGISPHIANQTIKQVIIRQSKLRWSIPKNLAQILKNKTIHDVSRLGKYLLFHFDHGTMIVHLGMSGRLYITDQYHSFGKHDHVDFLFKNGRCLRFADPRRFGAILWTNEDPKQHPLLSSLGIEPFDSRLTGKYLFQRAQKRRVIIKKFIMDSKQIAGIGNIYANEALFLAQIHPEKPVNKISVTQYETLVHTIRQVLKSAIKQGGTTLKDFVKGDGKPGYFKQHLQVYGRKGLPCFRCKSILKEIRIAGRSTVFCPQCQAA